MCENGLRQVLMLSIAFVSAAACQKNEERPQRPHAVEPAGHEQTTESSSADAARPTTRSDAAREEWGTLAEPARQLVERIRSAPVCTLGVDVWSSSADDLRPLLEQHRWAFDPEVGLVTGGVFCPPADPPPCTDELEIVQPDSDPRESLGLLESFCEEDWNCSDWECSADAWGGMQATLRFQKLGDRAVIGGTFQTPMTKFDDGTIDVAASRANWVSTFETAWK